MEEIDRDTIKTLSAETRLRILKMLSEHRATGADMSKRLGLSPSTINEHLKKLEASGLVTRIETGHKWVYYEPSGKGKALTTPIHPQQQQPSLQFVIVLAIGILMFFGGALATVMQLLPPALRGQLIAEAVKSAAAPILQKSAAAGAMSDSTAAAIAQPSIPLPLVAMLAGAVIIIALLSSSYYRNRNRNNKKS